MKIIPQWILIVVFGVFPLLSYSQDPFFSHFFNNRSQFNPALTGIGGSLSFQAKQKSQWSRAGHPAYQSTTIGMEETILCHFLDYGFFFNYDKEGAGAFETFEPGGRIAATLAFKNAPNFNIRIGASLKLGWKRLDFNQLIFSDQLDPRYGFTGQSSAFTPPDGGFVQTYLSPAAGIAFRWLSDERQAKVIDITAGAAVHNGLSVGDQLFGHTESVLGLDARIPLRWNVFGDIKWYLVQNRTQFFSVNPQILYQRQLDLSYLEAGAQFGFSRTFAIGLFYHHSETILEGVDDSNWFSINSTVGIRLEKDRRMDLGLSYSTNISGVRNIVGPIFELSATFHFKASPACSLFGTGDPTRSVICPALGKTKNNKIYDNIW